MQDIPHQLPQAAAFQDPIVKNAALWKRKSLAKIKRQKILNEKEENPKVFAIAVLISLSILQTLYFLCDTRASSTGLVFECFLFQRFMLKF